ncbi:hypothetical protein OMO38_19280 [Chryseobacterium sp. 09-1422]|uniref:Asparagine synthetase domain-containing protein n=1 Tax=Chryseobacterium kimseyorum TaxID=2984028 RepID=A0ABT3I4B5_9FLAO|nr:hypothetical protein [Chryseobacterium kimseyorum]MCW3170678.1 hypothetical protein [Chryseobacterium kimseyorum]
MTQISPFHYFISTKKKDFSITGTSNFDHSDLKIYIHPSNNENLVCSKNIIFFGECFDYENTSQGNREIVESLQKLHFNEKLEKIEKLSGFFIMIIVENDNTYILNDATGQLEVFICHEDADLYISSQPNIIAKISGNSDFHDNLPPYIANKKINIFSKTPYKSITKLISNFYYNVTERKYYRFPRTLITQKLNNRQVAHLVLSILQNSMSSMAERKNLGIAITAGWDSRVLFASSLSISKNINYYVLNHQSESSKQDVIIAQKIAQHFQKNLNVIHYNLASVKLGDQITELWKDDERIRKISTVMNNYYPDTYLINGNVSEIARNFYDPLPRKISIDDICYIIGVRGGNYEKEAVSQWFSETDDTVHLLDSIYWEHKMPNWAGSSKSISNIYNIVISPFNNRYLLNLLIATNRRDRDKYFHTIYKLLLEIIDKKLTTIPINPTRKNIKIRVMKNLHIYPAYRYIYFKWRKLKF